jgi:ribosomal protein S18 acetylase RimI-like enzyme
MGRLAVDSKYQRRGFGELLLVDAFGRTLASEIATFAFLVDAKDDSAERFYRHYDFQALPPPGRRLFLPVAQIPALLMRSKGR